MSRVAAPPLCPYSSPASEAPYVHLRLPLTPLPSRGCVTAWGADGAHPAAPGLPSTVCAAALAPHTRATPVLALPSPPPPPPGSTGTTCTPRCTCWTRGSGRSSTPSSSSSWRGPHAWRRDPCLAGERRQHRNDEQAGRNHCRRLELVFCLFFFRWGGADVGWDWVRQGMMGCCSRPRSRRVCLPGWGSSSARCDSVGRPLEASARGTRDASQALFPRVDQKARGERVRFVTLFSSQFTRPCTRDAKNKERGGRTHPHTTRQKRGKRKQ